MSPNKNNKSEGIISALFTEQSDMVFESLTGLRRMRPDAEREERSLFGISKLRPENCQPNGNNSQSQTAGVIFDSNKEKSKK